MARHQCSITANQVPHELTFSARGWDLHRNYYRLLNFISMESIIKRWLSIGGALVRVIKLEMVIEMQI